MKNMIFGQVPDIEQILAVLQTLQEDQCIMSDSIMKA